MILTTAQRVAIRAYVLPRLRRLGLQGTLARAVDPEDATVQDSLVIVGSKDGPYRTARRVGEMLIEVDEAFADLLVVRAPTAAAPARVRRRAKH